MNEGPDQGEMVHPGQMILITLQVEVFAAATPM